jgi:hypothetical protein
MSTDFTDWQLFNAGPFPAVVSRLVDGSIMAVNTKAAAMLQVPPADVVGRRITGSSWTRVSGPPSSSG